MPTYEYTCKQHGPFKAMASLSEYEHPQNCPDCGKPAPRNLITAPQIATTGGKSPKADKANGRKVKHAPGCACCS